MFFRLFWCLLLAIVFTASCSNMEKKKGAKSSNVDESSLRPIDISDIEDRDIDEDYAYSSSRRSNRRFRRSRQGQDIFGNTGFNNDEYVSELDTIYFSYDSHEISKRARQSIVKNIQWVKGNTSLMRIELEGHCDSIGSEAYNIGLGLRRAQSVRNVLISLGMSEDQIVTISYGEEKPISIGDYSKNRRVNFVPIY